MFTAPLLLLRDPDSLILMRPRAALRLDSHWKRLPD
jgi:hypothetical protein